MPKERREALLAEYHRSGMSGLAFARWAGIKYPTLATWLQVERRKKEAMRTMGREMSAHAQAQPRGVPESKSGSVQWVEAIEQPELKATEPAPSDPSSRAMVVQGPRGVRLELSEERHVLWAVKLLRHWEQPC